MKDNQILPACDSTGTPLQSQTNPPHRILVVDEDGDHRQLYVDALAHPDYCVDVAKDGADGWEALQANNYNLLITENDMPCLNGVELVKKLRAARMDLPVIMATGTLPKAEFTRYPSLQPAAMLLKPYTIAELLGRVKELLHATGSACEQIAPPPDRQKQPSAVGLRP
jgi:DNA-binding response OmpR family regulator